MRKMIALLLALVLVVSLVPMASAEGETCVVTFHWSTSGGTYTYEPRVGYCMKNDPEGTTTWLMIINTCGDRTWYLDEACTKLCDVRSYTFNEDTDLFAEGWKNEGPEEPVEPQGKVTVIVHTGTPADTLFEGNGVSTDCAVGTTLAEILFDPGLFISEEELRNTYGEELAGKIYAGIYATSDFQRASKVADPAEYVLNTDAEFWMRWTDAPLPEPTVERATEAGGVAVPASAQALYADDLATLRFFWRLTVPEGAEVDTVGAYIVNFNSFDLDDVQTKTQSFDCADAVDGTTFSADLTEISRAKAEDTFYAIPYVNSKICTGARITARVCDVALN